MEVVSRINVYRPVFNMWSVADVYIYCIYIYIFIHSIYIYIYIREICWIVFTTAELFDFCWFENFFEPCRTGQWRKQNVGRII